MLSGKDRGKQGRVIEARPSQRKVIVENLNLIKRHTRPKPMRDSSRMGGTQITPGGIIDRPAALDVSNVMLVCPTCKTPDARRHREKEVKGGRRPRPRLQARRLRPGDRQLMATKTKEPRRTRRA